MQNRFLSAVPLLFFVLLTNISSSQNLRKHHAITKPVKPKIDAEYLFNNPPEDAKPGVLWMWMGSNVSKAGITKDLEALKAEGFSSVTVSSLADVTMPWAGVIGKSPTPQIIGWTEPWWDMMRFAAQECKRLHMSMGIYNCPGYEASGGTWITPENSMQEVCWSSKPLKGGSHLETQLLRPYVKIQSNMRFPVYDQLTGLVDYPVIAARTSYYKDISVLAMPAKGIVSKDSIIDLTDKMDLNGKLNWDAPAGNWIIYRFGHTTTGALIQPAQPQATGLECDKMSPEAVGFEMDHMLGEIKRHMGDMVGTTVKDIFFDSYEIDDVNWTPKMKMEFMARKGYDITPFLGAFAGRCIGSRLDSIKFSTDFDNVVKDLYRDVYFGVTRKKINAAGMRFTEEAYGGPWRPDDVMPLIDRPMVEFWTDNGVYSPYLLVPTLTAIRKTGANLIQSEAFTGQPAFSKWDEYPAELKPIGDMAFCVGVNRIVIHRFVHQPWDDKYQPGDAMGQWGTHFDRTQTWWKPAAATVKYWQRCQALLQWGKYVVPDSDLLVSNAADSLKVRYTRRTQADTDIYFVANIARHPGSANCSFARTGMQPELWNPVTGEIRDLQQFNDDGKRITIPLTFDAAQSFFVVFRHKVIKTSSPKRPDFPSLKQIIAIKGTWQVQFDHRWGGPASQVAFDTLSDWTKSSIPGIKYFSGTAVYHITFSAVNVNQAKGVLYLDLGLVKHIAHVFLNDRDLGVIWTAPWNVIIPAGLLKNKGNKLIIEVTNVWANRLIGDEQEPDDCEWLPNQYYYNSGKYLKEFPDWFLKGEPRPSKGRYCFTVWKYFDKNSPLVSSGLMGPVQIMAEQ